VNPARSGLVRLEHLDAGRRQEPEDGDDADDCDGEEQEQLPPANAREEEDGEERRRVDEGRPQVRLEEHEQDRSPAEPERGQDRGPPGRALRAPDDEAGDREHEEHLPELRRLELDDTEVDPALRAAHGLRGGEHDDHQTERRPVQDSPVATSDVGRHEDGEQEAEAADDGGDRLPDDVVALVAGNVEARDSGDGPQAESDEARGGRDEHPVEAAEDRERLPCLLPASQGRGGVLGDLDHARPVISRRP